MISETNKTSKIVFSHPRESRFKTLFEQLKPKSKKIERTTIINLKDIMLNKDKRTSIIIKNIPEKISNEEFRRILLSLSSFIDYFYVPYGMRTKNNLRLAFINVLNCKQIVPIYMGLLYKLKLNFYYPDVNMEICYSKYQGKDKLTQRFLDDFKKYNILKVQTEKKNFNNFA